MIGTADTGHDGELPVLGVVIVTYNAADFIADCLESLAATAFTKMRIVVVDNASTDGTRAAVRSWASGERPYQRPPDLPLPDVGAVPKPVPFSEARPDTERFDDHDPPGGIAVSLLSSDTNRGFAGGVNLGLELLRQDEGIDHFWLLNPDTVVEAQTPFAFMRAGKNLGAYAVLGGRALFYDDPDKIHADAGRLHALTGLAVSVNRGAKASETEMPDVGAMQFIPGISMVVSRAFLDRVGLMDETYFLYFEEIDWQLRRGDLPLGLVADARVFHRAGASIGSGNLKRSAAPLSIYFMTRNVLPFMLRWQFWKLPFAYASIWLRLLHEWGLGPEQFAAHLRGLHGLGPPDCVRKRLPERVWQGILTTRRPGM